MFREVGQPGERWPTSSGGVGAVVIVEVEPAGQGNVALVGRLVEADVGPSVGQGAVKALDLSVGLRSVGTGPFGGEAKFGARVAPGVGPVRRAVVGQVSLDRDAAAGEPGCRASQHTRWQWQPSHRSGSGASAPDSSWSGLSVAANSDRPSRPRLRAGSAQPTSSPCGRRP